MGSRSLSPRAPRCWRMPSVRTFSSGGRGLSPEPSRLCDVRIKFEIEAWPAVKTAGDVGPFLDRAEAIAHASKVADETA